MTDFSAYTADAITAWLSQGTDMPVAPGTVYVTVFDDAGNELSADLSEARKGVAAGTGWTKNGTDFENTNEITLGEATADLTNVTDIALCDASTGGNVLARYSMSNAPFDVAAGTELLFEAGSITFDVQDRTE